LGGRDRRILSSRSTQAEKIARPCLKNKSARGIAQVRECLSSKGEGKRRGREKKRRRETGRKEGREAGREEKKKERKKKVADWESSL
jgi:hypothetical protein